MAYIDGYKHDVFISYAHLDNEPYLQNEPGWVSQLVALLRTKVSQDLGEPADIWMDYRLQGNDPVTQTIQEALSGSALLLFVVSEGYLKSPWCGRELNDFLRASVKDRRTGSHQRLFMVHRTKMDRLGLPETLQDLIGYHFWRQAEGKPPTTLGYPRVSGDEDQYWDTLNQLGGEIAQTLKGLKSQDAAKPDGGPTVLLAEVTEDLEPQRQELEHYFRQAGIRVLPRTYYPRDTLGRFQDAIDSDLKDAQLFVQLLSGIVGRKPPELPQGYPGLQYQRAREARVPIVQWRSSSVKLAEAEGEYRKVLGACTVIVEGMQAFKQRVIKLALSPPTAAAVAKEEAKGPPPRPKRIFVNTESGDRLIAKQIADCITRKGLLYTLSRETSIRKDLDKRLRECDGAIIVYASSPAKWVERQQKYVKRVLMELDPPKPLIKIGELRLERDPSEFINEREFGTILFGERIDCAALDPFLEELTNS